MLKVKDIVSVMEEVAPLSCVYTDEYDNVGLLVGDEDDAVSKIICCLDVTNEVIDEAITLKADMIISHHPIIFAPIRSVSSCTITGRKIVKAIKNGISVYSAHTNLDFSDGGINDAVCRALSLTHVKNLLTYGDNKGFGRVGILAAPLSGEQFRQKVASAFNDEHVLLTESGNLCKKVVVVNGGGGGNEDIINQALACGADTVVTGDVKHHVAVYAKDAKITLIEPQHYTMEYFYIAELVKVLSEKTKQFNIQIIQSRSESNPRK